MANPITLRKISGTWTLRGGGAVLAESTQALELTEQTGSTQIYFPKNDIAMALLEPSDHTTDCPQKGTAQYFSIINICYHWHIFHLEYFPSTVFIPPHYFPCKVFPF